MAHIVKNVALDWGATDVPATISELQSDKWHSYNNQAVLGRNIRGKKLPQLVPEFGRFATFKGLPSSSFEVDGQKSLPKGSKIIRRRLIRGDDGSNSVCETVFGIPADPECFIKSAVKSGHPNELSLQLAHCVNEAVKSACELSDAEIIHSRTSWFQKWLVRAEQLSEQEKALKSKLSQHIRSIVASKRILLFKENLADLNYPDVEVADGLANGFKLSGWLPRSHVFSERLKMPDLPGGPICSRWHQQECTHRTAQVIWRSKTG